ncbi:hypothetical protein AGDE_09369 [Angomonas deanei]|uniref:Kelch motif/Galactose oxidase, central domain containing protein, putative n=1 Tax=Angomonas deanei TaxID=59799 RepID=A0A7G2CHN3_9TRYP|nr:hypothetical protein AGDE_09369 [Angomonas deanei]CAD2218424.1 Kelch motif/Galactose oxidase, central domain containing protein, putative [Angomonas deanei]|eukprot:EPY30586.1 hypothetical protein AGDE_09369 [Angomonas deanei]
MYDTITSEWVCLWSGQSTPANKNVPTARFGHTIVIQDDSLYVYGGKTLKAGSVDSSLATSDVFVFSLNSKRWRRRLRAGKPRQVESEATTPSAKQTDLPPNGATAVPLPRAHHAVCVKDHVMFMNGGSGANSATLNDTWSLDLSTGVWTCLHAGEGADAIPRERHALLVCGEALLLMGGCTASMYSEKITEKYFNFVAVLPLLGQPIPCWIPVSMGNVSVVPPSRRGFAAAFSGGFAYVFGGMSGSEPASNNMVRFLSADGYVSTGARMTATANDAALRNTMQRTRRRPVIPFDVYISPGSWSGSEVEKGNMVGAHRVLLQQRAPILLKALQGCRSQPLHTTASRVVKGKADEEEQDDLLKDFVKQVNTEEGTKVSTTNTGTGGTVYFTSGNTRVVGLPHPLTAQELEALMDYVYWGGLSSEFRTLLEEEEEKEQDENTNHHSSIESTKDLLRKVLASLQQAATDFELAPLSSLCDALLSKSKKKLTKSRAKSVKTLRDDLLTLRTSSSLATATVLFVDPHTGQQTAHTLHPLLLSASSSFFADLLRPLYNGEKTQSQLGPVAAKVTLPPGEHGGLLTSTSKRAVLVGPVSIPTLAVEPVLRFLYSMELQAPRDMVFDVLLGSHVLNLPPLQAYCEAIVARTEVNYDTCCSFYYIARRYGASLLEEMGTPDCRDGLLPGAAQHPVPQP